MEASESEFGSEDEIRPETAPLEPQSQPQEGTRTKAVCHDKFQKLSESVEELRGLVLETAAAKLDEDSIVAKLRASMPDHREVTAKRSRSKGSQKPRKRRKKAGTDTSGSDSDFSVQFGSDEEKERARTNKFIAELKRSRFPKVHLAEKRRGKEMMTIALRQCRTFSRYVEESEFPEAKNHEAINLGKALDSLFHEMGPQRAIVSAAAEI